MTPGFKNWRRDAESVRWQTQSASFPLPFVVRYMTTDTDEAERADGWQQAVAKEHEVLV